MKILLWLLTALLTSIPLVMYLVYSIRMYYDPPQPTATRPFFA